MGFFALKSSSHIIINELLGRELDYSRRQPGRGPSPGPTCCGCLLLCPKDPSNVAEGNHDHELQELTTVQRCPVQEQPPAVPRHSDGRICHNRCADWHADDLPKYSGFWWTSRSTGS